MDSSNLVSAVSILVLNSSHPSIDDVTAVLKKLIQSGQRPYVACLTGENIQAAEEEPQETVKSFIQKQLEECEITMEKLRQAKYFNQLNDWKRELEKKGSKKTTKSSPNGSKKGSTNQSSKMGRDFDQNVIIDFPRESEAVKLYLILFDIFDCEIIKSIMAIDSSLKAIVNLHPRTMPEQDLNIEAEALWRQLMKEKQTEAFNDVAFIDLDVPTESQFMLNRRRKLIFDQFCHFFYDMEVMKSSFGVFHDRLAIVDVNINCEIDDLNGLKVRLDKVPKSMLTVEVIYEAILAQVSDENANRKNSLQMLHEKPFQAELFGKNFTDNNDAWVAASNESSKFYAESVGRLADSLHFWDEVEKVSVEKRQLLNYFMKKLLNKLESSGAQEHLEFYIYSLQFQLIGKETQTSRNFYENRSVGHSEMTTRAMKAKAVISDSHVDYQNSSKIPEEIAQLVNDIKTVESDADVQNNQLVHLLSPSALIQRLASLTSRRPNFIAQHFQLFDVILVKFIRLCVPKMFTTSSHFKILPTPLCFRDFIDYERSEIQTENNIEVASKDEVYSSGARLEDFILPSSIKQKRRTSERKVEEVEEVSIAEQTDIVSRTVDKDLLVYNASSNRIQFHLTESEFNSTHLIAKASTFSWLNRQKILNFTCQLRNVYLSISHDFEANNLQLVTITDNSGVKCSFDKNPLALEQAQQFLEQWDFSLSLPNGLLIKNLNQNTVEQSWLEGMSLNGESRRISFSNGFLMITNDEGVGVYSWNGTMYSVDVRTKLRNSRGAKKSPKDFQEATRIHQDSIASIQFLKDTVDISTFVMTLPNGESFAVERGMIMEKYETIESIEKLDKASGNLHIVRVDGWKAIHKAACSKVLFPDGTVITTWHRDDSIATVIVDDVDLDESILDQICSSESRNESKFVVDNVMNHISEDYFLSVKCSHQFEHKMYAAVCFDGNLSLKLFNDTALRIFANKLVLTAEGSAILHIDGSRLQMKDEKCTECLRSREVLMEFSHGSCGKDYKRLLTTLDCHGNSFEIKNSGRHAFYPSEAYAACDLRKCPRCQQVKEDYEDTNFGERHIVINRDYSGYELKPAAPKCETAKDVCFLEGLNKTLLTKVDIDDFIFDFDGTNKPSESRDSIQASAVDKSSQHLNKPSVSSKTSFVVNNISLSPDTTSMPSEKLILSSESITSRTKRNKTKSRGKNSKGSISKDIEITQPASEELETSTCLTECESISQDVSIEQKNLIQFYVNPLSELPGSIGFGGVIRLDDKCKLVTDTLLHLKKYSTEKFIFKARGLMETEIGKKEFEEHFKIAVRKAVEDYIEERIGNYRKQLTDAVIQDLLANATKSQEYINFGIESETNSLQNEVEEAAKFIPMKSFSFT